MSHAHHVHPRDLGTLAVAPPHDLEAERALLGCVLLDPDVLSRVEDVAVDELYDDAHREILTAAREIDAAGDAVDTVSLLGRVGQSPTLRRAGGVPYLLGLTDAVPTSANALTYAKRVRACAGRRRLLDAAHALQAAAYRSDADPSAVIEAHETALLEITQRHASAERRGLRPIREAVQAQFHEIERRVEHDGVDETAILTGWPDLDNLVVGLRPGSLTVVGARPAMGKTAFALNLADFASSQGVPVAIFELEMTAPELAERLICSRGKVDATRLRRGSLTESDWAGLIRAAGELAQAPIWVDDQAGLQVATLAARARSWRRQIGRDGPALVVVDYLQLLRGTGRTELEVVSEASRALKQLAKDLDVAVVAVAQLSRECEKREDKRPRLSDLRSSGQIEQDADAIAFLYRDEVYNPDTQDQGVAEVIVAKQRGGATGTVRLKWFGHFTRFESFEGGSWGALP